MTTPTPGLLHGEVVRLRPVTTDDAARLTHILTHPEVARWWGSFDLDRVQQELVDPDDGTVPFAIEADGQLVGLIQYREEPEPDYRHAAIDIFLHPDWHGRGLGADAIRTPPPTTSRRSAPTSGWGSARWGCCAATNAAPTAAGTTGCCWTCSPKT
jgi:RimJ/RimL family protein N-acetyltransferase